MQHPINLHPRSLEDLLLQIEQEQTVCAERADVAYRLARLLEERYSDLERQRCEVGALLQRLFEVDRLSGSTNDYD